jgi:Mn2+/Fe2+ NRAMP family transporter
MATIQDPIQDSTFNLPGQEAIHTTLTTRTAHLDPSHVGDIRGAWGTIRLQETEPPRTWLKRLLFLLVIMGPGLVTMVGDNDSGGVATYAQAGQNYGTSLLWTLLILIPVLIVNQEMVVRLGVVTGVGHARLIFERFGRFWGAFSVGDLFLLNFLTIVTEFIGFRLALAYFGISSIVSVPLGAAFLIAITVTGSFQRWERVMFLCVALSFLTLPLALLSHPGAGPILQGTFLPGARGGFTSTVLLLIIAIVGTTVAPWQLFFQQSNVIDKRLTPRWMGYERTDTVVGACITILGAGAVMVATAFAFSKTPLAGQFVDASTTASGLAHTLGAVGGALFALVLLNASLIGAAAVTLSTSYAFGDVFNAKHSLHRSFGDAKLFYGSYSLMITLAAAIVLIPHAPLGLLTTAVQALAGILLPSATVFLLLLCNDRAVLGPWVNQPWLNVIGSVIVGLLVILSLILAAATLFSDLDTTRVALALGGVLVVMLVVTGVLGVWQRRRQGTDREALAWAAVDRASWHMPPLDSLPKPVWSLTRKVGMLTMRGYLVLAVILMVVKVIQLALGH